MPYRGRRNEPSYLPYVADALAELHGLTREDVGQMCETNALNLFQRVS